MLHQERHIHEPLRKEQNMIFGNATLGETNAQSAYGSQAKNNSYSYGGTYGTGATASAYSHQMMQEANAYNAEQAELNRQWQERMANTAYQRAMKDLRKAGLNPILAYTNGGAYVGSGAQASSAMGNAYTDNYSESHGEGSSSSWGNSWEHGYTTSDLANQISAITGVVADMVGNIIGNNTKSNSGKSVKQAALDFASRITGLDNKTGKKTKHNESTKGKYK